MTRTKIYHIDYVSVYNSVELNMINALSAVDITFIMSSSKSASFLSPLVRVVFTQRETQSYQKL